MTAPIHPLARQQQLWDAEALGWAQYRADRNRPRITGMGAGALIAMALPVAGLMGMVAASALALAVLP